MATDRRPNAPGDGHAASPILKPELPATRPEIP
jgi:hypothetical protein